MPIEIAALAATSGDEGNNLARNSAQSRLLFLHSAKQHTPSVKLLSVHEWPHFLQETAIQRRSETKRVISSCLRTNVLLVKLAFMSHGSSFDLYPPTIMSTLVYDPCRRNNVKCILTNSIRSDCQLCRPTISLPPAELFTKFVSSFPSCDPVLWRLE